MERPKHVLTRGSCSFGQWGKSVSGDGGSGADESLRGGEEVKRRLAVGDESRLEAQCLQHLHLCATTIAQYRT